MRSLMQSVKRKVKSEQQKDNWDSESRESHINHEDLPVCRASRSVDRSVIVFNLPKLRDVPEAQRHRLLIKKLRLCSYVFEFGDAPDTPQEAKEKELKRAALLELVNHFQVFNPSFTDVELAEVFSMLRFNLFRPLPPNTQEALGDFNPEEDEPQSESTWPHLQVVYEFLHRLAATRNTDAELLNKYFNQNFILNLLELFDSEDPRERDYLKTILHRIYGNFMSLRPFIRRAINNVFYHYVYETDRHNGIAELLEIIGSIINGFAIPLKQQHKVMLERVLLPIHKATHVSMFHAQLTYCITQFLEKDQTLAPMIVRSVLKFWPHTCSKKEVMFLSEVEEILERVQAEHLQDMMIPLFEQLTRCMRSPHFQVSERSISVVNHDVLLRFVSSHREMLFPLLAEAMFCNTFQLEQIEHTYRDQQLAAALDQSVDWRGEVRRPVQCWQELGHWNPTIVDLTVEVLRQLQELDHDGLDRSSRLYNESIQERLNRRRDNQLLWESLDRSTVHVLSTIDEGKDCDSHPGQRSGGQEEVLSAAAVPVAEPVVASISPPVAPPSSPVPVAAPITGMNGIALSPGGVPLATPLDESDRRHFSFASSVPVAARPVPPSSSSAASPGCPRPPSSPPPSRAVEPVSVSPSPPQRPHH